MIRQQTRVDQFLERFETIGNSISFYLLLLVIGLGIWILTPLAPEWKPDARAFGLAALILAGLTMIHGALWFVLTRDSFRLPKRVRAVLATAIRFLRPLHFMTGLVALGIVLIHAYAFLKSDYVWDRFSITGLIAMIILFILAIDGIGLIASPLLSRIVHRWIALGFVIALAVHLWMVL
ncbi:hypothetical protein [Effusibacillus lacus]|uniref:Ferric oxidoreductase domain-containing protein n=1 Tax=Effusibacillus lacus TaxID=1348429 RepID=A0A292YDA5_9BACL|nr:hypothetical protein [Effusibacillus lacus]TCS71422.1 hypothetical protein EDD64_12640 [Effusibacillus lacus]GAX89952.1 hypothetical protein EFBL_1578 [Effusibacillus lacus]